MSATLTESLHHHHHSADEGASMMEKSQMFNNYYYGGSSNSTGVSEIEEEISSHLHLDDGGAPMATISEDDSVYVAVGKSETSMEALTWALRNLATSSTILYLIHVFPQIKHIPNPSVVSAMTVGMGMIPKSQVSSEQVETYMAQERAKTRDLLHKFLQTCSACKVKVDTILIESDLVAKAILDLIPILQITKLVLGANKSQLRKLRSRKGNGIADQVLQNAPENCKVRIVCEGKEVSESITASPSLSPSPSPSPSPRANIANATSSMPHNKDQDLIKDSVSCICFNFRG